MTYRSTIDRRLRVFFRKALGNATSIDSKTVLGHSSNGLGYDKPRLDSRVVPRLNDTRDGFEDVLEKRIQTREVTTSMKFSDLVGLIVDKSSGSIASPTKYRAKMTERVRVRLRELLAEAADGQVDPSAIEGSELVSKYVDPGEREEFADAVNNALRKYLLRTIRASDLGASMTVLKLRNRIVDRTDI